MTLFSITERQVMYTWWIHRRKIKNINSNKRHICVVHLIWMKLTVWEHSSLQQWLCAYIMWQCKREHWTNICSPLNLSLTWTVIVGHVWLIIHQSGWCLAWVNVMSFTVALSFPVRAASTSPPPPLLPPSVKNNKSNETCQLIGNIQLKQNERHAD